MRLYRTQTTKAWYLKINDRRRRVVLPRCYSPSKQLVFKVEKAGSSGWIQPFLLGTIQIVHQTDTILQ
jgi:hypothetical protein